MQPAAAGAAAKHISSTRHTRGRHSCPAPHHARQQQVLLPQRQCRHGVRHRQALQHPLAQQQPPVPMGQPLPRLHSHHQQPQRLSTAQPRGCTGRSLQHMHAKRAHMCWYVCVRVCACACIQGNACMHMLAHVCVRVYLGECLRMCVCLVECLRVCVFRGMPACVCVCIKGNVCVCARVFWRMRVCVCVHARGHVERGGARSSWGWSLAALLLEPQETLAPL